jgi:hypothetical protein
LTEMVWKPFCDRTGPEKVVLAIEASHASKERCLHVVWPGPVWRSGDPGIMVF